MVFCDEKKAAEFATCPGSPLHAIYRPVVGKDGTIELEISGYENTDEKIASYEESCDVHTLIKRFHDGDLTALNKRQGMYGDFTNMPKNMAEMLQLQIDAKIAFNSLDVETKKKFDNDLNKFLATAGSEEWAEKLGYVEAKEEVIIEDKE